MAKMSFDLFGALSPTDGEGESKVLFIKSGILYLAIAIAKI